MEAGYVMDRPNRAKASSKRMRAIVVFLLLLSAALMLIVILLGWSALQSGQVLQLVYVVLYLGMAFYIARWNRGPLPVAAALAIILAIFAAVAAPEWFARDHMGFSTPETVFGTTGLGARIARRRHDPADPRAGAADHRHAAGIPPGLARRGRAPRRERAAAAASSTRRPRRRSGHEHELAAHAGPLARPRAGDVAQRDPLDVDRDPSRRRVLGERAVCLALELVGAPGS